MYATASQPQERGRGAPLLLAHCSALSRPDDRPSAVERLEELVGDELAHFLLDALTSPGAGPVRGRGF